MVLKKSGSNHSGLCPFHSERSPSFSVSEAKQLYHCYGCKKGGDLVSFVMEMQGVSFPEAVEDLAERARLALPSDWKGASDEPADKARREKLALAFKLNRFAAGFYHQFLNSDHSEQSRQYLRDRGIGPECDKAFYLGASNRSWDSLAQYLISKKAPLDLAVELGLIRPSTKKPEGAGNCGYYDLFRNRILFPVVNLRGKVAGFGGRVLSSEDSPKYLNSMDSLTFQKSKLAFGLFQAQKYIREQDEIILVEGYCDVLAMHEAGFRNVVASCGTSVTADHLHLFKRLCSRMIVLFDGDAAGIAATSRAMELGLEQGQIFYGARLPRGLDPDEIVRKTDGVSEMKEILSSARPLLDESIDELLVQAEKSPEDQVQSLKKIGGWLGRFKDPVGRDVRLQLVQKRLGVSLGLMQEAVQLNSPVKTATMASQSNVRPQGGQQGVFVRTGSGSVRTGLIQPVRRPKDKDKGSSGTMSPTDKVLFGGLVFGGECSRIFMEFGGQLPTSVPAQYLFVFPPLRRFAAQLFEKPNFLERFRENPGTLMESEIEPEISSVLTEALLWTELPFPISVFQGAALKSASRVWARFSQRIRAALSEAESKKDVELQARLMKEYLDVQRKMKEFSSFYDQE